jgi:transcription elongation factor GreB
MRRRDQAPTKAAPYITPEGYQGLQHELDALWKRRAIVTHALAAAAAEGDRSENAEYIYRKKELREIDRRIRYLQKRMPDLTVVYDPPTDRQRIYFGAWVELEDSAGLHRQYRIVGPDEFDIKRACISVDSPLARALLKKSVDDEVTVSTPKGALTYYVVDISYTPPADEGGLNGP